MAKGKYTSFIRAFVLISSLAAGARATGRVCDFASGLSVPWVNYANDIPNPAIATFNIAFQNTHAAGGRIVRWSFHENGTTTPGYDASGRTVALPASHLAGVQAILAAADANGVAVTIGLWSFGMLDTGASAVYPSNLAILENDTNRQAYIDNYLTPLVVALKGTRSLYSWEIFEEPEGMMTNGWTLHRTTQANVQKTINWLAAAIHTADPSALVTSGAMSFDTCSNAAGKKNIYSDAALQAAGGKGNGILDYYEVHYFSQVGTSNSPFLNLASHFGLDKKTVIGEFAPVATDGVATANLYTTLYNNGYAGAWAYSYVDQWPWPSMQSPMQNLYNASPTVVAACPPQPLAAPVPSFVGWMLASILTAIGVIGANRAGMLRGATRSVQHAHR
jgi:hypothetical protein